MDSKPTPFRSLSSASSVSLSSNSTNITRVPSGPLLTVNSALNRTSSAQDHLYHKAKVMLQAFKQIEGMKPYLNVAYRAAQSCAEQQALALSQPLQSDGLSSNAFRASVGSGGHSIHSSQSSASNSDSRYKDELRKSHKNNIFTFTAGSLPTELNADPATELWKLLRQGAPLCLLFNTVFPDATPIEVITTDDENSHKKNTMMFLGAYMQQPSCNPDNMFTVSDVSSDSTHDLLKVMKALSPLVDKLPSKADELTMPDIGDLKLNDDKSKVFRELIQTERKYLADLELLSSYRDELLQNDALTSEQIAQLFPNLKDIIDFHRRLLNGFECNTNIAPTQQRIGSVFLHASNGPFKAYEPWTTGQISSIELINREAANLREGSSILDPGFELQSYIIKPVQRLCKYPLLLKELIKAYGDCKGSHCYDELERAHNAMRDVANQVNEAQRRAENVGFLQSLKQRVNNWRGFDVDAQGDLLYHAPVAVKDNDNEKEYVACLFEQVLFFFSEVPSQESKVKEKKMREFLTSRKKSTSSVSNSTANLLENLNNVKNNTSLELKGRVYVSEVFSITATNAPGYCLQISWTGKKGSGGFTLRYRTEEVRSQWETCLRQLKLAESDYRRHRDSRGSLKTADSFETATFDSPSSQNIRYEATPSAQRHHSSSSTMSMMRSSRMQNGQTRGSVSSTNGYHSQVEPILSNFPIAIHLVYEKDDIVQPLVTMSSVTFNELQSKIQAHISVSPDNTEDVVIGKVKYKDEDNDFVMMDSQDDWEMAVEMLRELSGGDLSAEHNLTIWVS